jgi:hypothetical protein
MSAIIGWIVGGGILAILGAIGAGFVWYYNSVFDAGKKSAKLNQAKANEDALKKAGEVIAEQRTQKDASDRLGGGTF